MSNSTIRMPAEWEPQAFVQYTFPHPQSDWAYLYDEVVKCFQEVILTTARYLPVLVVCHDKSFVKSLLNENTKYPIFFAQIPSNDTWARDHGALAVYQGNQPVLHDFTFNGWGNKFDASLDNEITRQLSIEKWFGYTPVIRHDFVLEGGSIESDGQGTLLTTSECLLSPERNPSYSKKQIENYLHEHLGFDHFLWLDHGYLAGDDTDSHIDTLARLCAQDLIAYVKCDDPADEHYEALKSMEDQLKLFRQKNGQPYRLVALPWPDACFDADGQRLPATYANFLIVNDAVLVPTYGVKQDQEALDIIQTCFPNRKIEAINCRVLIEQHGSLHCISMQFPKGVNLNFL